MKKLWKRILLSFGILILVSAVGFVAWGSTPLGPGEAALAALSSDSTVQVTTADDYILFQPLGANANPGTGLLFYPGGHVDYRSYAPILRPLAEQGYLVVLAKMPLSLAVFAINRADAILPAFPAITTWAIGGHSLGGAIAARYVYSHPGAVQGLILFASFPASTDDLTQSGLQVLSIFGSEDGGLDGIEAASALLPASTQWVHMQGGNHAQFGDYGLQPGDGTASISPAAQWQQIISATAAFLQALSAPK